MAPVLRPLRALSLVQRTAAARASALPSSHVFRRRAAVLSPRRFYSDAPKPGNVPPKTTPPPPPPPPRPQPQPKRKRGAFRSLLVWAWRATYLSTAGALVYVGYGVYQLRIPADQLEPAPGKKSLVVLGTGWAAVSMLKSLDTDDYNVTVISPRGYFLFTPLLPSCTTGTIESRSIVEPVRNFLRHKRTAVKFYEAEATKIDMEKRVVHINDESEIKGDISQTEVPFDFLVVAVGAENATFGIPGVREHSNFLKEVKDAQAIRNRIIDCCETAVFKDQDPEEVKRLLHCVVVGGGPTGVEFAGELQDFFNDDLQKWIPDIRENFHVTLIEALPNVLPSFSRQLIEYTEKTFKEEKITIRTKTMVKKVTPKYIEAETTDPDGTKRMEQIPYGLLVWATGNAVRPVIRDLMSQIPEQAASRRGLLVTESLQVKGAPGVWAAGDCAVASSAGGGGYAPTAQVASQQGSFLARLLGARARCDELEQQLADVEERRERAASPEARDALLAEFKALQKRLRRVQRLIVPFEYSHQGSLAYIGSEKAVADISWLSGNVATGGTLTYLFWRSAYLSMTWSVRNRILVLMDWVKTKMFGRDVSRE